MLKGYSREIYIKRERRSSCGYDVLAPTFHGGVKVNLEILRSSWQGTEDKSKNLDVRMLNVIVDALLERGLGRCKLQCTTGGLARRSTSAGMSGDV